MIGVYEYFIIAGCTYGTLMALRGDTAKRMNIGYVFLAGLASLVWPFLLMQMICDYVTGHKE